MNMSQDDHIEKILRDYVPAGRSLPGVRSAKDEKSWPSISDRPTHVASVNSGGEYVAYRRTLLERYASTWLLALHDQDIAFYTMTLSDKVSELTSEASMSSQVGKDEV